MEIVTPRKPMLTNLGSASVDTAFLGVTFPMLPSRAEQVYKIQFYFANIWEIPGGKCSGLFTDQTLNNCFIT